jgi:hypothetical protein
LAIKKVLATSGSDTPPPWDEAHLNNPKINMLIPYTINDLEIVERVCMWEEGGEFVGDLRSTDLSFDCPEFWSVIFYSSCLLISDLKNG